MDKLYKKLEEIFLPHSRVICDMVMEELLSDLINLVLAYQALHENAKQQEIEDYIIGEMKKRVDLDATEHRDS